MISIKNILLTNKINTIPLSMVSHRIKFSRHRRITYSKRLTSKRSKRPTYHITSRQDFLIRKGILLFPYHCVSQLSKHIHIVSTTSLSDKIHLTIIHKNVTYFQRKMIKVEIRIWATMT